MDIINIFNLRKECLWILVTCTILVGTNDAPKTCSEKLLDECRSLFNGASICQVNEPLEEDSAGSGMGQSQSSFITCPGPQDPANHTACCYGNEGGQPGEEGHPKCCLPLPPPGGLFYIDDQLAMIIALSVTTVCVICTIIIIVCCFWSRCPLYTACRIRYHQDDIIAYASKDEETAGLNDMPPEETKGVNIYSPNAVKVTLKEDV